VNCGGQNEKIHGLGLMPEPISFLIEGLERRKERCKAFSSGCQGEGPEGRSSLKKTPRSSRDGIGGEVGEKSILESSIGEMRRKDGQLCDPLDFRKW